MNAVLKNTEIQFQPTALDIWAKKYQLKAKSGVAVDADMNATYERVARALASVEKTKELQDKWYKEFKFALEMGCIPAGRIMSNAGANEHKPATSTINCTVSGLISDSMDNILAKVHEAGLTLKAGCGIGYEFSTLRPKGAFVKGAGANTSGPLSFMDIYDKMCFTVSSAGGRRGAQMATFDIGHPDILDFVKVKRENGRLRQFNLSCLITKEFMDAVKSKSDWKLAFPVTQKEIDEDGLDLNDEAKLVWRTWPTTEGYVKRADGKVACRVYQTIAAEKIWNVIMSSTYDFAEPGFILIDRVNEMNNNWFCENIRATNPCGEQPLPQYGACLLGSINLTKFIKHPFATEAYFDYDSFDKVVAIFTRMLDNVVEINGLPLPQQRAEIERKRRHGMGYLGLGSSMAMLGMTYGDKDSVDLTEEITKRMALTGWKTGLALAKEKGVAPVMDEMFEVTSEMLATRPEMVEDGFKVGERVKGRILFAKYSRYMQLIATEDQKLVNDISKFGCRFTHHSSIAPTGTISLALANNASNGIEPSFSHHYARNVIVEGKKSKEKMDVYSYELLAYRALVNPNAMPFSEDAANQLPPAFVDSSTIPAKAHVDVQAASQKWIDSSIWGRLRKRKIKHAKPVAAVAMA